MKGMRKILPCLLAAVLLAGCGATDAVRGGIGDIILLENRNEAYFEQLSPQKGYSFHVPEGLELTERSKNLIFSTVRYMNHDGFNTVLHEDGSVTVTGVNHEKRVFLMIAGGIVLPAGDYAISDGGVSKKDGGFRMQVIGPEKPLASLPGTKFFTIEEPEEVKVFIVVDAGTELTEVTFYPEVCLAEDDDDVFDPYPDAVVGASGNDSRALLFKTDRDALKNLSDDDRILFDNNLFYIYKDRFLWVSLMFEDGNGVQIVDCDPDKALYGKMDIYGRVYEAS